MHIKRDTKTRGGKAKTYRKHSPKPVVTRLTGSVRMGCRRDTTGDRQAQVLGASDPQALVDHREGRGGRQGAKAS